MHKHASWIVALIVGVVMGAAGDRMVGGFTSAQIRRAPAGPLQAAQRQPRAVEDVKAVYRVPVDDSPVKGNPDALVTIVESSDFQCPFCKRVLPTLQQLERDYGDKVRFVFKENPLSFHDKALQAAMAAEEARAQGGNEKFWAMHDKLFAMSPALDRAGLEQAAKELGLDLDTFRRALDSGKHAGRIRRDQALVAALGANGTPSFFVNGRKLTGAQPIEAFKALVDEELRKAEMLVKSGAAPRDVYAKVLEGGATSVVYLPAGQAPQAAGEVVHPPAPAARVPVGADDPAKGPPAAKVTIVEFSDFQCPFCSRVGPTLAQLEQTYGKDLRVVWKHQPLAMHPNAFPASLAAEAAREQGKFWPLHDLLFRHQTELSPAKYEEWAKEVGLDLVRFKRSIEAQSGKARIEEDQKLGNAVGATGTPTLFVNCRRVMGAQPYEVFKTMMDEELNKANALLGGKSPDAAFYERICEANVKAAPVPPAAEAALPGAKLKVEIRADDPAKGPAQAPVTLVEFSDFQCPFCSRAEPTVRQLEQAYGKDLRVVWKHQPLPMHPNAMPAAEAAEAAREQGKFWPMHEKLFQNQAALSPEAYERFARELGLDLPRFKAALSSEKYRARIQEDMAQGERIGANGTPTFLIDGELLVGAQPFEAFKAVIDRHLEKAKQARR
ncbi:MAG TPA: thioredoxin domain-containing protein [Anaeromyxobacteraceae bacterium]|jgi:protein-disulfide isomerase|nr:thioredoxin domain-containing protein [Anaeromyxobacteraceae bacterium]